MTSKPAETTTAAPMGASMDSGAEVHSQTGLLRQTEEQNVSEQLSSLSLQSNGTAVPEDEPVLSKKPSGNPSTASYDASNEASHEALDGATDSKTGKPDTKSTTTTTTTALRWPETPPEHPLSHFYMALPSILHQTQHDEVYGIKLSHDNEFHTKLILQKFLRANENDLTKATEQLQDTLKWRKEFDPIEAAAASYPRQHFDGLGWIIELDDVMGSLNKKDVVTFNVYGSVKDTKKTFGDLDS